VVKVLILIHPPSQYSNNWYQSRFLQGNNLTTGRKIMEYIMFGIPQFDGQNGQRYEMWSIRMKTFLEAHGYDVWKSVVTGYTTTKKPKTATKKELKETTK
jgi:hypothetical protein